ncbi:MAG TPA: hypothetical protein PLR99_13925 [Polyangiaceae bacterium]|nr:hypothetical protein [Polyangiaceae bacterium]
MVDLIVTTLCFIGLVAAVYLFRELTTGFGAYLIGSYVGRIAIHFAANSVKFFHHEVGGDARIYETLATWIANQWSMNGFSYMTARDNAWIGATSLPPNIFAVFIYLSGGQSARVACTSVVVLATCLSALNFFRLAMELGSERRVAVTMTMILFALPGVVFYTSDMYKDGLVLAFTLGAVGSAIRVSRRFSVLHAAIGVVSLGALWFVRFYMVFLAVLPIAVGYMGFGSKRWLRPTISTILVGVALWAFAGSQGSVDAASSVEETFDFATGRKGDVGVGNAYGGSAVELGKGLGSIPVRVLYTLFSPFPWQAGTVGLHLGKVDTLIFTYLIYRGVRAARALGRVDRPTLLSLLAYILPTTFAYSLTFANMGLMLRQRIPVVVMVGLLAVFSWPRRASRRAPAKGVKAPAEGAPARTPRLPRPAARPGRLLPARAPRA